MSRQNIHSYLDIAYPEYRRNAPLPPELLELCVEYLYEVKILYYDHVIPWVNGKRHGVEKRWYDNGQLEYETHWVIGKKHGIDKEWYDNGQLSCEIHWKNGEKYGVGRMWDISGYLLWTEKYLV